MKRIIYLLSLVILSSCTVCTIAQIPPQYLYVGENCSAVLPDYLPSVTVSDNCELLSITQEPQAGLILNSSNNQVTVKISAWDKSGNMSQIEFLVSIVDTIPPLIIPNNDLLTEDLTPHEIHNRNHEIVMSMYDQADRALIKNDSLFMTLFPWDKFPGIDPFKENMSLDYFTKNMVIRTAPTHAYTGHGYRIITFESINQ